MRLLITGAAGFIGSHLVRTVLGPGRPLGDDVRVTALDKLTYAGRLENLAPVADEPGLTFVHGDITDTALIERVMPGHDAVLHLAAESHVDRSIESAQDFVTTNVLGTSVLLDAALRHGVGPFVHVSTDEVYGSVPTGASVEDDPCCPAPPTPPPRPPATCWPSPTTTPTASTSGSPAAPTTTARTSTRRS